MRAVLRQRLLADGRTLQTVNASSGWLADDRTGEIGSFSAFSGTKEEASWLPDEQSAKGWQVVVKETK
jgi:hypothetical protein